jgi:hypothetical protein
MIESLRSRGALIGGLAIATSILVLARDIPLREPIILALLLTAPGLAVTILSGIQERIVVLLMVVPVSLAIVGLVSTGFAYLGLWSTELVFLVVMAITLLAAGLGAHERAARGALVGVALIPGIVLIFAELSVGAPG